MVGDTWRDDIVGAVEAGSHARWVNREGRASHARRFIVARELSDAYPDRRRAAQMTERAVHVLRDPQHRTAVRRGPGERERRVGGIACASSPPIHP